VVPPKRQRRKEMLVDDLGPATAKWDYFTADGQLIACVYRYDPPGGRKEFRPWDAQRRKMAPPDPRPLYNQPGMVGAETVVLVEGEKCAQALIDQASWRPLRCTARKRLSRRPTGRR
jgi:putative DNA primase/helicase